MKYIWFIIAGIIIGYFARLTLSSLPVYSSVYSSINGAK